MVRLPMNALPSGPSTFRLAAARRRPLGRGLTAFALAASAACGRSNEATRPPMFTEDVAPIVFKHCVSCHRPGQGAPFALLTYEDARRRATRIGRAVSTGHMPPWLPAPSAFPFVGERRLNSTEADIIWRWVDAGAPEGPRASLPPAPQFTDGWELGSPDLVVTTPKPFALPAGTSDVFRNLVLAVPVTTTRYVRAVEFETGGAPVHHAVVHIDRSAASRRLDGADGQPGFEGMGARDAQDPDGHFLGWAPGRGPIVMPEGMPWRLDPGTDLVLELHLVPGDAPAAVAPRVALYFADGPPVAVPVMFKMGSKAIDIPAGQADYAIADTFVAPADLSLLSLYPHAHYLGKEMRVEVELPDGRIVPLLHIPRWNFRWQQDYRFATPVALPRGAIVRMRFTYDNSSANDQNPFTPPQQVMCGPRTVDEMGNLGLQVVPRNPADRHLIQKAAAEREVQSNLAGAEMLMRNNPASAEHRTFLAASLVDAGRAREALPHLELAIRLDPRSANAYNELGGAYVALGQPREALTAFTRASSLAPDDDRLLFNLAALQAGVGRRAEAEATYRRVLKINPNYADAVGELGVLVFGNGRTAEAITLLRRAVTLAPDVARLHSDLGGALAQAGRYAEARTHVERALALDPTYQPAIENLRKLAGR